VTEAPPTIGMLTERVSLLRKIANAEDEGGHAATYLPLAIVWARVRALSARHDFASDARTQSVTHSVTLRFRTDLKAGDRIVHRAVPMRVESAMDLNGRRTWLACQCVAEAVTG